MTTRAHRKLLDRLDETPTTELSGNELQRETGVRTWSLYPALMRLEEAGLVSSRWDESDPIGPAKLRRRLYRITHGGRSERAKPKKRGPVDALADLLAVPQKKAVRAA